MKKNIFHTISALVLAACIMMLGFAGCSGNQSYSFGPQENVSEISSEYQAKLQERLNAAGVAPVGVSFYGYNATFDDQGRLTVEGFFRNRTGETITNLECDITIRVENITVAYGHFSLPEEDFGTLESGDSRPWTLIFGSDDVINRGQDMSNYQVMVECNYTKA